MIRLGFDRDMLVDSIRTRLQNKATVTYYLMMDNRRRMPSSGYLSAELSEGPQGGQQGGPPGQASSSAAPHTSSAAERSGRGGGMALPGRPWQRYLARGGPRRPGQG